MVEEVTLQYLSVIVTTSRLDRTKKEGVTDGNEISSEDAADSLTINCQKTLYLSFLEPL